MQNVYLIFEENNKMPQYAFHTIDPYLKAQIGLKESKVVYRIDKYPDVDFLKKKEISQIICMDADTESGVGTLSYENLLKQQGAEITFRREHISILKQPVFVGAYETYLLDKNSEYAKYRSEIESRAANTVI